MSSGKGELKTTKIVREVEVPAPPDKVFALVSAPEKWPQWASIVKRASSNGKNTHWIYDMGGMKVESDTEVTEIQENRLYEFRQTKGFLKSGKTRIAIEPKSVKEGEGGSKITWTLEYELPYSYLGKLMDKMKAKKQFEQAVEESLSNLDRVSAR